MFEPIENETNDLEWMLGSDQAPKDMILEALVEEYYAPVFLLALSILDDKIVAHQAAREALAYAMIERYRYREQFDIQLWLFSIAVRVCKKFAKKVNTRRTVKSILPVSGDKAEFGDSKPETDLDAAVWLWVDSINETLRLVVLLKYVLEWKTEDIGRLLNIPQKDLESRLNELADEFQSDIKTTLAHETFEKDVLKAENLDSTLRDSLQRRYPKPRITVEDLNEATQQIGARAKSKSALGRGISYVKEMILIGIVILALVFMIWMANTFWPEKDSLDQIPNKTVVTKLSLVYVTATPNPKEREFDKAQNPSPKNISSLTPNGPTPVPTGVFYDDNSGERLSAIADELGISLNDLRALNRIPPGEESYFGQRLLIPGAIHLYPSPTATPVPSIPQIAPITDPFSINDLLHRIQLKWVFYQTLWFEAQVLDYGPVGYIGPPRIQRVQAWLGQDQSLVLFGSPDGEVREVWLSPSRGAKTHLAKPFEGQPWFFLPWFSGRERLDDQVADSIEDLTMLFENLVDPNILPEGHNLVAADKEFIANRDALVMDLTDDENQKVARFWFDDRTGLMLGKIFYSEEEPQTPTHGFLMTRVAFDVDFPQDLFDPRLPWRGGFAIDQSGAPIPRDASSWVENPGRERLEIVGPPFNFDPSNSRLSFQLPDSGGPIELFADEYYLGDIYLGVNPWKLNCTRSPDGMWIAYTSEQSRDTDTINGLFSIYILEPLENSSIYLSGTQVQQLAFSPDSRYLAVFAYNDQQVDFQEGSIYIIDLKTGDARSIIDLAETSHLVWHPEGDRLAVIARPKPDAFEDHMMVIDTRTGGILQSVPINLGPNNPVEWLEDEWGVEYITPMGDLEVCTAPPE